MRLDAFFNPGTQSTYATLASALSCTTPLIRFFFPVVSAQHGYRRRPRRLPRSVHLPQRMLSRHGLQGEPEVGPRPVLLTLFRVPLPVG
jgi:hypothetical protein